MPRKKPAPTGRASAAINKQARELDRWIISRSDVTARYDVEFYKRLSDEVGALDDEAQVNHIRDYCRIMQAVLAANEKKLLKDIANNTIIAPAGELHLTPKHSFMRAALLLRPIAQVVQFEMRVPTRQLAPLKTNLQKLFRASARTLQIHAPIALLGLAHYHLTPNDGLKLFHKDAVAALGNGLDYVIGNFDIYTKTAAIVNALLNLNRSQSLRGRNSPVVPVLIEAYLKVFETTPNLLDRLKLTGRIALLAPTGSDLAEAAKACEAHDIKLIKNKSATPRDDLRTYLRELQADLMEWGANGFKLNENYLIRLVGLVDEVARAPKASNDPKADRPSTVPGGSKPGEPEEP